MKDRQIWCNDFFNQYVVNQKKDTIKAFYRKFELWDGRTWDGTGTYSYKVLINLLNDAQNEVFYSNLK